MAPAWSVQTLGRSMDGFKNGGLGFSHGYPLPYLDQPLEVFHDQE